MKVVKKCDPDQFANIRVQAFEDELQGIDPGAYWARIYPYATELEFVVVYPKSSVSE